MEHERDTIIGFSRETWGERFRNNGEMNMKGKHCHVCSRVCVCKMQFRRKSAFWELAFPRARCMKALSTKGTRHSRMKRSARPSFARHNAVRYIGSVYKDRTEPSFFFEAFPSLFSPHVFTFLRAKCARNRMQQRKNKQPVSHSPGWIFHASSASAATDEDGLIG